MSKKPTSTFDKEMKKASFRKGFKKEYQELLLSELIIALMEGDHKSVRQLAREANLSPTVIQNLRTGKQRDIKLTNFRNISQACGYHIVLEKNNDRISLD